MRIPTFDDLCAIYEKLPEEQKKSWLKEHREILQLLREREQQIIQEKKQEV